VISDSISGVYDLEFRFLYVNYDPRERKYWSLRSSGLRFSNCEGNESKIDLKTNMIFPVFSYTIIKLRQT